MCAPVFIILDIICLSSALPVESFESKLLTPNFRLKRYPIAFMEKVSVKLFSPLNRIA